MLYRTPVPLLQQLISNEHFHELEAYDAIWGLERHREIVPEVQPAQDIEAAIKQRMVRKGQADAEWTPKPDSLNRRLGKAQHGKRR